MNKPSKIQQIFLYSYEDFQSSDSYVSGVQEKAAHAILNCKSGSLGYNITQCSDCGHMEFHNNSCRNRNCPNCQAILKEFSGSAHLGTNTKLSSSHSLHCFRRWSVRRPKTSQMWRKVLYSSSRNGKSISWKVSLLSAKVLCHRQTCFLVFLCRTSEFLLLE